MTVLWLNRLNLHCDVTTFVSPVRWSGQIKKFGQMQELTNDDYTNIKLYSILNVSTLNYILIKSTNNYMADSPLAGAVALSFQYGEFLNNANTTPVAAPASAPVIISATTSPTSVHLKWRAPLYINAPLLYYKVVVAPATDLYNRRVREVVVTGSPQVMSEVVTLLAPRTLYVVYLTAVNQFGEGPASEKEIETQRESEGTL